MNTKKLFKIIELPKEIKEILLNCKKLTIAKNIEPYIKRKNPDGTVISYDLPSEKKYYKDRFNSDLKLLKRESLNWLKNQNLALFIFNADQLDIGIYSIAIIPDNAGFFESGLSLLQNIINPEKIDKKITIKCALFIAPPFRHTHFNDKQIVIHNRTASFYEIFSYNLYPGQSAKKGIYSVLLHYGEHEKRITNHSSKIQVVTSYNNNKLNILHKGANGSGKSEMNKYIHRDYNSSITLGKNIITKEKRSFFIPRGCSINPAADNMVIFHPSIQRNNKTLTAIDAENGWFIRIDHIKNYGTDPDLEFISIHSKKSLLFLNIAAQPSSSALFWEHIEDFPGKSCPNPRFILPKKIVPNVIKKPVSIDIKSFGVRTSLCTKEKPTHGILGLFYILPPALAWLWCLISHRGIDNPSIIEEGIMGFEG